MISSNIAKLNVKGRNGIGTLRWNNLLIENIAASMLEIESYQNLKIVGTTWNGTTCNKNAS